MIKLFDSELKIMEILWKVKKATAKEIAEILKEQIGWSKTTTYTVIKKCIDKGAIMREEPNFVCKAVISQKQAREFETTELINKMYDGSTDKLVASILENKKLSKDEINNLKELVNKLK